MSGIISFFSSDIRPLYKTDIYSVCCLPKDYIIQFRYDERHIDIPICDLQKIIGMTGVIFFTHAEEISPKVYRAVENISVRNCTVKDFEKNADTGRYHFYLQLGDFVDYQIDMSPADVEGKLPVKKYVSLLKLNKGNADGWDARVEAIKTYFKDEIFVKIEILEGDRVVEPHYVKEQKQSHFDLNDEVEYILKTVVKDLSDPTGEVSKNSFTIKENADQLDINCPDTISIGAKSDVQRYRMVPRAITATSAYGFVKFKTSETNGDKTKTLREFSITLAIKRNVEKSIQFALCSIGAVLATVLTAYFIQIIKDSVSLFVKGSILAWAFGLAFISSFYLYKLFGKK